ncbi:response regulator [bacterium]|nr:response regulator [bacterium]
MNDHTHSILIVEDSPDDFYAAQRGLKKAGLANALVRAETGEQALAYLDDAVAGRNGAREPDLILLDLNLPGIDGVDVLKAVKAKDAIKTIPVIVLTTSEDPIDIEAAYTHGASSYVRKPVDLDGFMAALARLKDYWFEVVLLPGKRNEH